jgi:hypothetical protein
MPRNAAARRAPAQALANALDSRDAQLHWLSRFSKQLAKLFRNEFSVFLEAFPLDVKKLGPVERAFDQRKA